MQRLLRKERFMTDDVRAMTIERFFAIQEFVKAEIDHRVVRSRILRGCEIGLHGWVDGEWVLVPISLMAEVIDMGMVDFLKLKGVGSDTANVVKKMLALRGIDWPMKRVDPPVSPGRMIRP